MKSQQVSFIQKSKILRTLKLAFIAIFLGAIGSGLWDRFLSPVYEWASNAFLHGISFVFHGYVDVLHSEIGKGQTTNMAILPYVLIVVIIIFTPWFYIFLSLYRIKILRKQIAYHMLDKKEIKAEEEKTNPDDILTQLGKRKKTFLRAGVPVALLMTVLYTLMFLQDAYTRKACIFIERSIDIVSPCISPEKVLQLRASYRSISKAKEFYDLDTQLQTIAINNKIKLPKFTVIR